MNRSLEACGEFTTTAGLTFELDKSVNGYRIKITSFLKKLGIDIVLDVIPNGIE